MFRESNQILASAFILSDPNPELLPSIASRNRAQEKSQDGVQGEVEWSPIISEFVTLNWRAGGSWITQLAVLAA